jgi:hypothetical protein
MIVIKESKKVIIKDLHAEAKIILILKQLKVPGRIIRRPERTGHGSLPF